MLMQTFDITHTNTPLHRHLALPSSTVCSPSPPVWPLLSLSRSQPRSPTSCQSPTNASRSLHCTSRSSIVAPSLVLLLLTMYFSRSFLVLLSTFTYMHRRTKVERLNPGQRRRATQMLAQLTTRSLSPRRYPSSNRKALSVDSGLLNSQKPNAVSAPTHTYK